MSAACGRTASALTLRRTVRTPSALLNPTVAPVVRFRGSCSRPVEHELKLTVFCWPSRRGARLPFVAILANCEECCHGSQRYGW
jgi:hypothetical protein